MNKSLKQLIDFIAIAKFHQDKGAELVNNVSRLIEENLCAKGYIYEADVQVTTKTGGTQDEKEEVSVFLVRGDEIRDAIIALLDEKAMKQVPFDPRMN